MKKIFGGINLTWKKLIVFAIITGIYTAIMALLPITRDTSFRDIAVNLEWWIFFGVIIICNSKSPIDSALKCFVFFLISQPLIYLIQVPFSNMGFGLFKFYKYWFIWTLLTLPMGFIGYYINKRNLISVIILLPMLLLLAYFGLGYFTNTIENFPHHLLSFIACFAFIIVIVLSLFDKKKCKIITLSIVTFIVIIYIIMKGGILVSEFETYRSLDGYDITFEGNIKLVDDAKKSVEIVVSSDSIHTVKIKGKMDKKYMFIITDESEKRYIFEYYYNEEMKTVILERIDQKTDSLGE